MNTISSIKRLAGQLLGLFPSRLPMGMSEFDAWAESIIATYTLPTQNRDDILFVLSNSIIATSPTATRVPKFHFVKLIRAVCAKQIAGAQFMGVKQRQQDAQRKAAAEATANLKAVENVAELNQPV